MLASKMTACVSMEPVSSSAKIAHESQIRTRACLGYSQQVDLVRLGVGVQRREGTQNRN